MNQHNDSPRFFPNPFASEYCEFFKCRTQRCRAKYIIGQPSDSSLVQPGFLRVCEQDAISILSQLPPELLQYIPELKAMEAAKDGAYAERNKCVALIAQMALAMGLTAGIGRHPEEDETWERDWMNIVFIDLPAGQCSWHIHDSEIPMFSFLPEYAGQWDGHNTEEKYRRVLNPILPPSPLEHMTNLEAQIEDLKEQLTAAQDGLIPSAAKGDEPQATGFQCPYCDQPPFSAKGPRTNHIKAKHPGMTIPE